MAGRGWNGAPPSDDDDARSRIIEAAMRCVDRFGPDKTGLSDVAAELGVTRQTVYRLFAGTDELMRAVVLVAADRFVDRLVSKVRGLESPAEMLVECVAFTLERLPHERYLASVVPTIRASGRSADITSHVGYELTRALFARLPVDWAALGLEEKDLQDLAEIYLRTLQSFELDPGAGRTRAARRELLRRWLGATVAALIEVRSTTKVAV